jgi:23S rRNA pseudouridine2604 synthase
MAGDGGKGGRQFGKPAAGEGSRQFGKSAAGAAPHRSDRAAPGAGVPPPRQGGAQRKLGNAAQQATRGAAAGSATPAPTAAPATTAAAARPPQAPEAGRVDAPGMLRLSKRMSELGLCSRREADEWITNGWVQVDGVPVTLLGSKVTPEQKIEVAPAARAAQLKLATILLHKPIGYVSGQPEDDHEPAVALLKEAAQWENDLSGVTFQHVHLRALAPAGRLDIDSTGLLVFTQDGRVAKQLIGENSAVEKEYLVRVRYGAHHEDVASHFPAAQLALLCHGLTLDDAPLKPARVDWQNGEQLRFVLREGKKRQIRRMCELVGLEVVGLKRVRIGQVMLGALPVGQWRYLTANETF